VKPGAGLVDDRVAPDVPVDRDLGLLMIDEYVRYPATPTPA
jgi:hypothetical protein